LEICVGEFISEEGEKKKEEKWKKKRKDVCAVLSKM